DGYESSSYKNVDSQIVFAYDDNIIKNLEQDYLQNHANGLQAFQVFFICSVLSLVVLVAVCIGAGRRMDDEAVYLRFIDHLYLDVHGAGLLLVESMTFTFALASSHYNLPQYIPAVIVFVSIVLLYNFVLSFTRIAKAHQIKEKILILKGFRKMKVFFKKIECFKRIKALGRKLRGYYHQVLKGSPLVLIYMGAVILCVGLGMLFIWAWPLAIVLFCAALWFVGKHAKSLDLVINGVERVQAGEVNYKIETQGYGKIEKMAENINCINEGMNRAIKDAVEKELKSERLKTELITNVSHDIRTPLTSIITYIDLLKKEDIDEESRKRYITVLENKAARLKTLTDDLFEAAKASTGNIEVNLDKVNIESLINQGMGELEDKIKAADLEFIVKRPEEKIIVEADGRLLWRVLENLLNNVLKYAMKGSRVYVTIDQDLFSQMGVIVIKNISAQALNIQPEELMERFKRGDDTRHSDGSGLGLAIAKDLTELQNGRFQLEIDGDLFKTTVYLKMTEATEATEAECETP
ncbi:MAG: HAMP domain-containing sensor histidine kinase, partial [Eubacterium sp.]